LIYKILVLQEFLTTEEKSNQNQKNEIFLKITDNTNDMADQMLMTITTFKRVPK